MTFFFQDRRSKARGGDKVDASLTTLITIYLLILAFLATIYSISSIELSKVGTTMNAVQSAFHSLDSGASDTLLEYEISAEDFDEKLNARGGLQPFYEAGAKLIQSSFSLESGMDVRQGQGLFIYVPANRIFIGVSNIVRPEFESFSSEIALLLAGAGPREKREIEIVFLVNGEQQGASAQNLAEMRMDSLARNLIEQGVLAENIILGLRAGDSSKVSIGFYSRLKSGAELDFADLKGVDG